MKYVFGLLLLLTACEYPLPPEARNTTSDPRATRATDLSGCLGCGSLPRMRYYQNDEINTCFAHMTYDRSAALATIDCDKVPPNMLIHFRPQ